MGSKELSLIAAFLVIVSGLVFYNYSENKRRIKIENAKKALIEAGNQVKQYYEDKTPLIHDSLLTFPPEKLETKTWDFTQKQPNWILLPKPEHDEQSKNGLNLRINSSQTVSLSNNKDSWDSAIYKTIAIECGPIFEKVEVSVTLINESGDKINISEKLILKEGSVSLLMDQEKTFTGKIKELQLSIKNTNSRNMSVFNIKSIQLSN